VDLQNHDPKKTFFLYNVITSDVYYSNGKLTNLRCLCPFTTAGPWLLSSIPAIHLTPTHYHTVSFQALLAFQNNLLKTNKQTKNQSNKKTQQLSKASPCLQQRSGSSYCFIFISLSNSTHFFWSKQNNLLKLYKLHGTITVTTGLQFSLSYSQPPSTPISSLLSSCTMDHSGKSKYTTATEHQAKTTVSLV
jgi:hypothetical protein